MPFTFRMQKILDYREQLEEEAKIQVAQAQAKLKAANDHRAQTEQAIATANQQRQENPTMSAQEFWVAEQYMRGLNDDLRQSIVEQTMAEGILAEAKKLLAIRAIDKKMLIKLKERQHAAWIRDEKTKEQHVNDEIATIRYKKAPAG
ncbi:MAG: flagellar export protein FliJ [Desulfovibrio sp.]|nr:flagellar export protein FliJ [Desulfovibrio sp.]